MKLKDNVTNDTFTLSLGGTNVVNLVVAMPAISHVQLRQDRGTTVREPRRRDWRIWMPKRSRVM